MSKINGVSDKEIFDDFLKAKKAGRDAKSESYDRVMCVSTGGVPTLTLNKVYDAKIYYADSPYWGVTDDIGDFRNFKKKRFILLSEYRIDKLKQVGL